MLSLGTAEHLGSHFWLSQRFGAPGAVQDAKVIEGRVRSDVGLIFAYGRTSGPSSRDIRAYGGAVLPPKDRRPADGDPEKLGAYRPVNACSCRNEYFIRAHIYVRSGILTSRFLSLADDHRTAFSIVLVGNQIADLVRAEGWGASGLQGRRTSRYA